MNENGYVAQPWRMTQFYPDQYAKSLAALDAGIDYDEARYERYELEFLADLDAHDRILCEAVWNRCLDEIEAYEINTEQARKGNPYRANPESK